MPAAPAGLQGWGRDGLGTGARGRGREGAEGVEVAYALAQTHRTSGRLMLQGMQNQRVWGAVINEQTGRMWATVGEDDGAIVLSGACIAP